MSSSLKVAVFGLGSIGFGMAESLIRAGHTIYGFDAAVAKVYAANTGVQLPKARGCRV